jgi:hypothetical protein
MPCKEASGLLYPYMGFHERHSSNLETAKLHAELQSFMYVGYVTVLQPTYLS